jgi:hypothetical protein
LVAAPFCGLLTFFPKSWASGFIIVRRPFIIIYPIWERRRLG